MASLFDRRQKIFADSSAVKKHQVKALVDAFYKELDTQLDSQAEKRILYPSNLAVNVIPSSIEGFKVTMSGIDTLTEASNTIIGGFIDHQIANGYPKDRYTARKSVDETIKVEPSSIQSNYLSFTINI